MPTPAPTRRSILIATAASSLGAASCAVTPDRASVERYIIERSKQWTDAYITGNPQVMETILADNFVNTNPRGKKSGKSAAIASAKEGPSVFLSAQTGPIDVRVYGNMAIVFGGDILVLRDGTPKEITTAWTDTWLLRSGQWQAIASHESEVELSVAK